METTTVHAGHSVAMFRDKFWLSLGLTIPVVFWSTDVEQWLIGQTILYGSYKGRRELLWLSGCILLALMLGMAFTGYLLPWDEKAYFAVDLKQDDLEALAAYLRQLR